MRLIVSLTSVPQRLPFLKRAIEDICGGQSRKADLVVLYLPTTCSRTEESYKIPQDLANLHLDNFQVRRVPHDYGPITKLVYGLADFPDDIVVSIDDDIEYHSEFLAEMLDGHSIWPHAILGLMGNDPPSRPFVHSEHIQKGHLERQFTQVASLGGYRGILVPPQTVNIGEVQQLLDPRSPLMQLHQSEGLPVLLEDDFFWACYFKKKGVPMYVIGSLASSNDSCTVLNLWFRKSSETTLSLYNACRESTLRSRGLIQLFFDSPTAKGT